MGKLLDELWYGTLCPSEKKIKDEKKYKKLLKEIEENEKKLFDRLSNEQIKLYEKCVFDTLEANSISEKESFKRGFRLGVRLILESIKAEI